MPGVVAVLARGGPADHGEGPRPADAAARPLRGRVRRASPWRSSSPSRPRRPRRTRPSWSRSSSSRCRSCSMPRPRWIPRRRSRGSRSPRRATGRARWTPRPTPASAGEGTNRSRPRSCPQRGRAEPVSGGRRRRGARRGSGRARGPVHDLVGPPGLPRAAGLHAPGSTTTARSWSRAPTQAVFGSRNEVAKALGLPSAGSGSVPTPLGGAFGGKWPLFDTPRRRRRAPAARPVRLIVSRAEDFAATNPASRSSSTLRIGVDADGRFLGLEAGWSPTPGRSTRAPANRSAACSLPGRMPGRRST